MPTAVGDSVYTQNTSGTRGWKNAGAKNVYVLHTYDRKLADTDSFVAERVDDLRLEDSSLRATLVGCRARIEPASPAKAAPIKNGENAR